MKMAGNKSPHSEGEKNAFACGVPFPCLCPSRVSRPELPQNRDLYFFGIRAVSSPQFSSELKMLKWLTVGNGFLEGETWQSHNKCKTKSGRWDVASVFGAVIYRPAAGIKAHKVSAFLTVTSQSRRVSFEARIFCWGFLGAGSTRAKYL